MASKRTVWVLGDQLNRDLAGFDGATPRDTRVLVVRSQGKARSRPFHRQRVHLVWAGLERFACELEADGFEVDRRDAPSLAAGLAEHRRDHGDPPVRCMEPLSWDGLELLRREGVEVVRSNQMLCHHEDFAAWAGGAARTRMEDFYRWQRVRLGVLLDGSGGPEGGRWNLDHENREPPPKDGRRWPPAPVAPLDDLDREVAAALPETCTGAEPAGLWATTRAEALRRLDGFISDVLPGFGPHEDAMLTEERRLAHSMLSHAMNVGLLHPGEVARAAEEAYRAGGVPLASAEGFIRQVIGWREYVWGTYWRLMPGYRHHNVLGATRDLPPAFTTGRTQMRCLATALEGVHDWAWTHHIQRLMVLGNLTLIAGVEPQQVVDWMWSSFVDGAEWVMLPNLVGMSLHADGGLMATKPYAAGGAYINRMSDHCRGCTYDPKRRTGDDACPYTTLYWDFLDRHRERFEGNHRMRQPLRGLDRLADLPEVRRRAAEVLDLLDRGEL